MPLIGRQREIALLDRLLKSREPEFLAIYGRRRVGKTFLVREYMGKHLAFEMAGIQNAPLPDQLANFQEALSKARANQAGRSPPTSWLEAFARLRDCLASLPKSRKAVVFLDEVPWLAGRKSKFLPALDHFWNDFVSRQPHLILIVCGSAASWMISKVINNKGGLHNRVTARLRLEPFSLGETEAYLASRAVRLTRYDLLTATMACGGIPHYLKEAEPGMSAAQIVDQLCFSRTGLLRDEFARLYRSLFDHSERHVEIARALAKTPQGQDRAQLTRTYASGGRLTQTLEELSEAGFVAQILPYGKLSKDAIYRLADEYSIFYLRWIEPRRGDADGAFLRIQASPAWRAWSGYALESLAYRHLPQIKQALGIASVETSHSSWLHRPNQTWPDGAQIDLLLERADNTINLFEIKFAQGPFTITKSYAMELRRKLETFKAVTKTRHNVFLTFVTTHGLTQNSYAAELAHRSLSTDSLFSLPS